jgi:hypothetical protein
MAGRRSPRPVQLERLSLLQLLDERHNAVTYGTPSAGRETVAVPFAHVVLLTSESGQLREGLPPDLCHEIKERIETRFEQSIDPWTKVRVGSAATRTLNAGEMIAYIGEAIFVPLDGEQPTGRVRVGRTLEELNEPRNEPRIFDDRPAGIYRGQSALAFGSSHLVTPAIANLGLPDEVWFHVEAVAGAVASMQPAAGTIDVSLRGAHAVKRIEASDTADVRFRFDFVHGDPSRDYNNTLFVEIVVDERPSRLLREAPRDRPAFEIAGFRVTDQDLADGVETFWFDFGLDGYPIGSAMTPRETTIVYDGRRIRRYSWRDYDYEGQAVTDYRVKAEQGGFTFRRADGQPLGFLAAPASPVPAVFRANWWTVRGGYHLDWLDFAGCVENAIGNNKGLAEIHAARGNVVMPPFAEAPKEEFPIGPLILRRTERARP